MKSKINFHLHTKHSDGLNSVAEVVEGLKRSGVEYFSVTDHDCIDGCEEAGRLAFEQGLKFVSGVELSCCFDSEADGLDFTYVAHILGYGFDIGKMSNALNRFRMQKYASLKQLFDKLVSDGYALRKEKCFKKVPINYRHIGLLALSKCNEFEIIEMENRERFAIFNFEDGVVTERKIIAKELVELGAVESVNAAFNKILNVSPYVQYAKCLPSIKDGIEAIHKCGGVAVAAHPLSTARGGKHELKTSQAEQYIDKLYQYGIDGLEVFYQGYDKKQIEFLDGQADKFGLIKSISTDYHGMDKQKMESDESYKQMLNRKGNYLFAFEKDGIEPCENITDYIVCDDGKYKEHWICLRKGNGGNITGIFKTDWDSVSLLIRYGHLSLSITDGNWDRAYALDYYSTFKLKKALDLFGKTEQETQKVFFQIFDKEGEAKEKEEKLKSINYEYLFESDKKDLERWGIPDRPHEYYLNKFEELCKKLGLKNSYSSWS